MRLYRRGHRLGMEETEVHVEEAEAHGKNLTERETHRETERERE
jgi:hypothetical protein